MQLFELVFGRRGARQRPLAIIEAPPAHAEWRKVKPRKLGVFQAELAITDGEVRTDQGALKYKAGQHYILTSRHTPTSVVRRDIFERTYRKRILGGYEKRPDVVYRYFTLDHPALVKTAEGPQRAEPGDWIIEGVAGELWPVSAHEAQRKYAPA